MFVAADKAANKGETGVVNKADARLALGSAPEGGARLVLAGLQAPAGQGLNLAVAALPGTARHLPSLHCSFGDPR